VLDRAALGLLRPGLTHAARGLAALGVRADHVTLAGFALGLAAAGAVAGREFTAGLMLMLASRLCDGIDGALARLSSPTERGAFLDITLDFLFYAAMPLAFAVADPAANALPAAVLLAAFVGTGSSFLAYAAVAARLGRGASAEHPNKGLHYIGGLTEGSETLLCFAAMCLWPQGFALLALGFAALCALTIASRLAAGWHDFKAPG